MRDFGRICWLGLRDFGRNRWLGLGELWGSGGFEWEVFKKCWRWGVYGFMVSRERAVSWEAALVGVSIDCWLFLFCVKRERIYKLCMPFFKLVLESILLVEVGIT